MQTIFNNSFILAIRHEVQRKLSK